MPAYAGMTAEISILLGQPLFQNHVQAIAAIVAMIGSVTSAIKFAHNEPD
jgi:hypothetical protein